MFNNKKVKEEHLHSNMVLLKFQVFILEDA